MKEGLINFGAWRNKDQMLRFMGVQCKICGKKSLQDRPCFHTEDEIAAATERQKQSTDSQKPEETNGREAA